MSKNAEVPLQSRMDKGRNLGANSRELAEPSEHCQITATGVASIHTTQNNKESMCARVCVCVHTCLCVVEVFIRRKARPLIVVACYCMLVTVFTQRLFDSNQ